MASKEEAQSVKPAVRHTSFIEVHQGEMVALTRRLGALPGFRLVQWQTHHFTLETSPAYMLNGRDEPRYCGCTISVLLGTAPVQSTRVRYDPVFDVVFLEVDETKGDVSARNHSMARAASPLELAALGEQLLGSIQTTAQEKRGTKRLRFTAEGLQSDMVTCQERKAAVDKLVDQWSRLDALDPDRTR